MSISGSQSGQSASSFGSGISGTDGDSLFGGNAQTGADGEVLEETGALERVFSVAYTVTKEKGHKNWVFVFFRLLLDWLQLYLIVVNPDYGWHIDPDNKAWQAFSFIQLYHFMSVRGYTFYLFIMYILVVWLASTVGLSFWISSALQNNNATVTWPIQFVRYTGVVFQILDVCLLTVFLMTLDCQYLSVDAAVQGYNQEFPDVYCWTMPHLIHVFVVVAAVIVFLCITGLYIMADVEINPAGRNLMAMARTKTEVVGFSIKMLMVAVSVFVPDVKWMSIIQMLAMFALCYMYLRWQPHQEQVYNHIRVGYYFSVLWAALIFVVMAYHPGLGEHEDAEELSQKKLLTVLLWAGSVPAGLLGAFLSYKRAEWFLSVVVGMFRAAPLDAKPRKIYKFTDAREVEIASRCCRVWVDEDTLDDEVVALAERIVKAGVALLPHQPYMHIWWSSFLIDVQGIYQAGYDELQNAKKSPNQGLMERYCVFVREQDHAQKSSAASGNGNGESSNLDLVSYVEFQRNYKLVLHLHFEALVARRTFWETLLHHNVTFDKLARAVERMETTIRAAERMYKQVLGRHSNSIKILVLYVKFLQGLKNDPWNAARWTAEVEKMQRAEEEANERTVFGEGKMGALQNHDDSKGIIIMGANCLVRMINEPAAAMFGYTNRAEVVGKNINIIVPPPFARNHNNYVRNYITTGQAKILNRLRDFVALHKDRYVVPIQIYVTKVSGVGEDSVFLSVFDRVVAPPNTATIWIMSGGLVLSCDCEFSDWLGYRHEDIHSKVILDLVGPNHKKELEELMTSMKNDSIARKPTTGELSTPDGPLRSMVPQGAQVLGKANKAMHQSQSWTIKDVEFKHMYLDLTITADITLTVGGIGDTALCIMKVVRKVDATPMLMVTDSKGRVTHVTSKLANTLGVSSSKLQAGGMLHALDFLLPAPFARIHHQWYRDKADVTPVWSCRSGLSMCLNALSDEGPCVVPFKMEFRRKDMQGKESQNVVLLESRTMAQALDERRLSLTLNSRGIVTNAGTSPVSLFGFDPQALVGSHLSYVVDILRPAMNGENPSPVEMLADEEKATKMLFFMAQRSYDHPGMSWRCGITAIMDPVSLIALGPIGMAMMAKKMVPAVLVVDGYLEPPTMEGARVLLPSEMQLKVELWRADLLSGVLELDTQGNITQLGIKDQPIFNPHLILGLPPNMITGTPLSSFLPLQGKQLMEALFTEGSFTPFGMKPGGRGAAAGGRGAGRGGLRNAGHFQRRKGVGPLHVVRLQHGTDHQEIELQMQAVVKQDMGTGASLYILMHLGQPHAGRKDFKDWLFTSPLSMVNIHKNISRRGSVGGVGPPQSTAGHAAPISAKHSKEEKAKQKEPTEKHSMVVDGGDTLEDATDILQRPVTPPKGTIAAYNPFSAPGLIDDHELNNALNELAAADEPLQDQGVISADVKGKQAGVQFKGQKLNKEMSKKAPNRKASGLSMKSQKTNRSGTKGGDDGDESDASDAPGLKEGGRERIKTWMNTAEPSEADLTENDGSEEEEEEQQEVQAVEDEDDQEGAELDEAGSTMNDYKRGKRLKKLAKVLLSPQSQARNVRLKWVSIGVVLVLVVVDLAMFITFMQLVDVQKAQVIDLRSSAKAVNRVLTVCIHTGVLQTLMAGKGQPTLRHLGMNGTMEAINYHMSMMTTRLNQLEEYHHGVYRGFSKLRQLPTAYNLRSIWDDPNLNILMYYQGPVTAFTAPQMMGLWDAGNIFIKCARNILQNMEATYGFETNTSHLFVNDTDVSYLMYNGPRNVMTAYQATLDGLMQQAIDDSTNMNSIQLIILGIEGGLIGMIAVAVVWVISSQLVAQRRAVFSIFMTIPNGIIRGLATVAFNLEEGANEEEEEGHEEEGEGGHPAAGTGAGSGGMDPEQGSARFSKESAKAAQAGDKAKDPLASKAQVVNQVEPRSWWDTLTFWRAAPPPEKSSSKRTLQRSLKPILWLAWPFMFWACFVIIINAVGYMQLKNMSTPIAISNVVQFVAIRCNRVQMFAVRLCSEFYFDAKNPAYTAAPLPPGVFSPLKQNYKKTLRADADDMRLEYEAMLYGHASADISNRTEPHFALAKIGIMFSAGAELMYNSRECFCQDPSECYPPDHEFYQYTRTGLDQMIKHYFYAIDSLLLSPDDEINMHSNYFKYIYEVGSLDLYGGLILLTDLYTQQVVSAYDQTLTLHIVAFALCCGLGFMFIVFIMRPNFKRVISESRRVAELFAQLPPEVQVEPMVAQALRLQTVARAGDTGLAAGGLTGQRCSGAGNFPGVRNSQSGAFPGAKTSQSGAFPVDDAMARRSMTVTDFRSQRIS